MLQRNSGAWGGVSRLNSLPYHSLEAGKKSQEKPQQRSRQEEWFVVDRRAENQRVHCWIKPTILEALQQHLVQGEVVQIENFAIIPYQSQTRNIPFDNYIFVSLKANTIVTRLEGYYNLIPQNVFVFSSLQQVQVFGEAERCLIDVIGIVASLEPIRRFISHHNEEMSNVNFTIVDTINTLQVNFFNDLAISFNEAMNMNNLAEQLPIVVISSCKGLGRSGTVSVSLSLPLNEFLKPTEGENYYNPGGRDRGRGWKSGGGFGGSSGVSSYAEAPAIGDPSEFLNLGDE
ncbi:hypothetical protein POM88_021136 [Heracleum sosnowskyi]|uniref:Uncharacterized protein n=1 Tax=Heracleum sosnowskyi TaxID=360622 RepID=A0AAD8MS50_9APIA|nr:hypothetical protein POM88_021136 [Heracleum sosnowskyi]